MGNSYVRQSAADIQTGLEIRAAPFNAEFNALEAFASGTTGHSHDGTTGEGPLISLTTSITGTLPVANGGTGLTAISDLLAIEALAGTSGGLHKTAANTWALRTLTGTANQITVTNGDGVAGNPTLSLPTAITLGTVTINTSVIPDVNDGAVLGASGNAFSDLFLASGAVINFNAGAASLTNVGTAIVVGGTFATEALNIGNNFDITLGTNGDLNLQASGTISWSAGDVVLSNSTNLLTLTGGAFAITNGTAANPAITFSSDPDLGFYRIGADTLGFASGGAAVLQMSDILIIPATNNVLALGSGSFSFADLFLGSGGVINFNNGDVAITHSSNALDFTGADALHFYSGATERFTVTATGVTVDGVLDLNSAGSGLLLAAAGTSGANTIGSFDAGTYTPTLTNSANLDGSTAIVTNYIRIADVVWVFGQVQVDPTAATTLTTLGMSLPIASNFSSTANLGGTASGSGINESWNVSADTVNDRATFSAINQSTSNHNVFFLFSYRVI